MTAKPKRQPFRSRSWRFYRNWLIYAIMWTVLIVAALRSPWYIILIWALPAYFVASSIFSAYRCAHPVVRLSSLRANPARLGVDAEPVEFPSRDGLNLFGWYMPGRTRSAVILVHGLGATGMSMIYHAIALAEYGCGVLMFDLRAHGASAGDTCTAGWLEAQDLLGALDYVQAREDVDPDQIAALGMSLGARVVLRAAAQSEAIRAVVAEGPGPMALSDHGTPTTWRRRWINRPLNAFVYWLDSFMNGTQPSSHGLLHDIQAMSPRPLLLISTGKGREQYFARKCYEAAREPKELWELPEARHGAAFFKQNEQYTEKVVALIEAAGLDLEPVGTREEGAP